MPTKEEANPNELAISLNEAGAESENPHKDKVHDQRDLTTVLIRQDTKNRSAEGSRQHRRCVCLGDLRLLDTKAFRDVDLCIRKQVKVH